MGLHQTSNIDSIPWNFPKSRTQTSFPIIQRDLEELDATPTAIASEMPSSNDNATPSKPPSSQTQQCNSRNSTPKRPRAPSLEILDVRPAKHPRHASVGSVTVPLNDADQYRKVVKKKQLYPFPPSDKTFHRYATRNNLLPVAVFGLKLSSVILKVVPDDEGAIPWQVPKVMVEFNWIAWRSSAQPTTNHTDGQPVSPRTLPSLEEMTSSEYEEAIEAGNFRVALMDEQLFNFCKEIGIGWLTYDERQAHD